MKHCIVYGLYSSRDGELRYIGQTTQRPATRLNQHRNYAKCKTTAVHKWFLREVSEGFNVQLRVLCNDAVFNTTEIQMLADSRKSGARLLNHTDGGEGTVGWRGNLGRRRPDLAERNRRNRGKPGHPMSVENKAKLVAAVKARDTTYLVIRNKTNHPWIGRKHTEETKAKIGAGQKNRPPLSEDARRRISEANTGRKLTPEQILRLRAAHAAYVYRKRYGEASV